MYEILTHLVIMQTPHSPSHILPLGPRPLARLLGVPVSTVGMWQTRGKIPRAWRGRVRAAVQRWQQQQQQQQQQEAAREPRFL